MNVLITGAAGFIASHLIEELLKKENIKIIGIDNLYSGTIDNIRYLESLDNCGKFHFFEVDIREFDKLNEIIKDYNIKEIYHMAALVSVQDSIEMPLLSHEINILGSLNVLEASRVNQVKRIVFSSSAAVYGDEKTLPKSEISPVQPISPYGCEKLTIEHYMEIYSKLYGLETVSLRYFNVYGPRQNAKSHYSGVISIFEANIRSNQAPNIYGNGEQYRDFVHVKDVANINIMAMELKNISNEIFCVGTGKKITINYIFDMLNKKYQTNFLPIYKEARNGDILESVCDNSKLKKILKIETMKSFEEGILEL